MRQVPGWLIVGAVGFLLNGWSGFFVAVVGGAILLGFLLIVASIFE